VWKKALDETLDEPALGTADRQRFGERFVADVLVGGGGMGMVLRGLDLLDGSRVALKVLHRKEYLAVERFTREAENLAGLQHPAIVRYVAHGRTVRGEPYLAMEWLDGESLADRLERVGLEPSAAARLGARVLRALAVAHGQGIVHRDIKPSNLFLVNGDLEQAKLLDFGIASKTHGDWQVTRPGGVLGTPLYMAPEQGCGSACGSQQVDGRADIFSLGCVLYECISGEAPSWRMVQGRPAWDEEALFERQHQVPEPLRAVLDGMTALAPESRPAQADKLADELTVVADLLAETRAVPVSRSRQTLSAEERRSAVVLFGDFRTEGNELRRDVLREALAEAGAKLVQSAGAQMATATFPTSAMPADQAIRAARVALRLRKKLPSVALTIGMNTELPSARAMVPSGSVRIDAAAARLLEGRFELQRLQHPIEGSFELLFEKGVGEVPLTLMGKELPCFGRQREIRLLEGLWQEVCETPVARAMVVAAPAGAGKSRVRHQFCEAIQAQGQPFELLIGRGDPMHDGAPFALLGPSLLTAAGISGSEPEAAARERFAAYVTRFLPESDRARTVAFLGEMANLPFPDDDLPALRVARIDPRAMADQKLMAWLAWLEAVSAQRPVLIVLEDLHWGDAPSVQFVDAALRVLAEKSLLVLAIARPEVDRRFPSLWHGRSPGRLDLPPLSPRWSRSLVEHVAKLSDERAGWIVDRAQGNPFFLQELLRMEAEGRSLRDGEIPETVLGAVQARLDTFGPDAKLVLRAASVFGQTFRPDGVRALLDRGRRQDVEHWLGILEKKEIVYASGEHDEYLFRHALLREAAYDLLPAEERRLGHQLAGQFLEHAGQRDGTVLADHFERGGDNVRAIHWLAVAAEQALAANDLLEAIGRVERATRLGASGEDRCALRLIESWARYWRGEYREAEDAARDATKTKDTKKKLEATTALLDALAGSPDRG
jgi:hypothetical protein